MNLGGESVPVLEVGTLVRVIGSADLAHVDQVGRIAAPFTTGADGVPLYQLTFEDGGGASGFVEGRDFVVIEIDFDTKDPEAVERYLNSGL